VKQKHVVRTDSHGAINVLSLLDLENRLQAYRSELHQYLVSRHLLPLEKLGFVLGPQGETKKDQTEAQKRGSLR
jgi:hypothetical protein